MYFQKDRKISKDQFHPFSIQRFYLGGKGFNIVENITNETIHKNQPKAILLLNLSVKILSIDKTGCIAKVFWKYVQI